MLVDEVGTPDSSRFWPADAYRPGQAQPSFDKQYVRDWLDAAGWDHEPPPPLPADVVDGTAARYREAYERVTGRCSRRTCGPRASTTLRRPTPRPWVASARSTHEVTFEVLVTLKPGLADPRAGRKLPSRRSGSPTSPTCTWGVTSGSTSRRRPSPRARTQVQEIARRPLSNPVIEDFRVLESSRSDERTGSDDGRDTPASA